MKKFLLACVLALPVTVLSGTPAWAWGCGFNLNLCIGVKVSCSGSCGGCCTPCCDTGCNYGSGYGCGYGCDYGCNYGGGYDGLCYGNAGYPTYDSGTAYARIPAAAPAPTQAAGSFPNYGFQPVGYSYQAPAYWYGR